MNDTQPNPTGWKVPEDLLEWAWSIIANAGGGDWEKESKEWRDAATAWRDTYHTQPKPTGELRYDPTLEVPQEIIAAAHKVADWATKQGWKHWEIGPVSDRAALAAERESDHYWKCYTQCAKDFASLRKDYNKLQRTLEAAYENHKADVARLNADYTRELNHKLEQINAQAGTIQELVEALKQANQYALKLKLHYPSMKGINEMIELTSDQT